MTEESNQQDKKFKAGFGIWMRMVIVGIVCAGLLPIVPLVAIGTLCGMGFLCFLVDHSPWVSAATASVGLVGGMFLIYKMAEHSHKQVFEDRTFGPEVTVESRKGDAWIGYLNQHGRGRHGGR